MIVLTRNIAVCVAYALTGWLALQIAVPPGYVAPLFPPAGIALAALFIHGTAMLPGVFLGSFLVQVLASTQSGGAPLSLPNLIVPFGAVLQAYFSHYLARRWIGLPNALDSSRSILRFVGLVAPVGCMLNASLAIPLLVYSGTIARSDLVFSWVNWWAGDTLGVLIMVPLALVFLGTPARLWRSRRSSVAAPMLVALSLLAFTFFQVRDWEGGRLQSQFNRDADFMASLVKKRLDAQLDQMLALERLAVVHPGLTAADWREFVMPMLERYPGTQNFGWSPLVRDSERDAFEARARAAGNPGFQILGRNSQGQTYRAGRTAEYLPILYVEPLNANRTVLGLDPTVLDRTAAAARRSKEIRKPVATASIRLVQEQGTQRGVVVYQAAFERNSPRQIGLVSGVFRMDDAINAALAGRARDQMDLCLIDDDVQAPGQKRLYGPASCETSGWLGDRLHWQTPVSFGGRLWTIRVSASPSYMASIRSWGVWLTLVFGLLSTGILGAFLLLTSGRTRRVEALVGERTRQLAAAGRQMRRQQDELAQAQRVARLGSWEQLPGIAQLRCSSEIYTVLRLPSGQRLDELDLLNCIDDEDRPALAGALLDASAGPCNLVLDCRLKGEHDENGQAVILHFRIESEAWGDNGMRVRGNVQDVTEARAAAAHIAYLAHNDVLTGLPNRTQLNERAKAELRAAGRYGEILALLFVDLDHFKSVNDSLGHPVGDMLLAALAKRFTACLREYDFVARLGGDEFVILLPRLKTREDAALVSRKLLAELSQPVLINEHELRVSASIGIALFPEDGEDMDTLLKHADVAMYSAKEEGRNNFHYFLPEMDARAVGRLMLENALRRALERDELVLHYQPQVRAEDGKLLGFEALVRWQHPELGLLPPGHFITVAEESGLILPLGKWVLRTACRQMQAWRAAGGAPVSMAVNICALQFRQADFVSMVSEVLAETGADPDCLELELTETTLMQPTAEVLARMAELRAKGIQLVLDDFGTGYSSMSYLKRLPIRRLKLDRSFVKDLPADAEDAAIATATLSLARDLGLEVVAEGVEHESQREFLIRRGCQVMQGFLFGRPEPAGAFQP